MTWRSKSQDFYRKHTFMWFVLFTALCVSSVFIWKIPDAVGSDTQRQCQHTTSDGGCWFGPTESAKKFRNGYFHHAHGVPVAKAYKAPKMARGAWVTKITTYLKHHPKAADKLRGKSRTSGGESLTGLAKEAYDILMVKASCIANSPPGKVPSVCTSLGQPYLTVDKIQKGGAVAFCAGNVVLGVLGAPATKGRTLMVATWGASQCGWSTWIAFG